MEEKLINRLESAVTRLEALSTGGFNRGGEISRDAGAAGPSIAAFDDLISQYVNGVISVAENIGGKVLDISKIIEEAFNVQKDLLIEISQTQKPDTAGLVEFLKPLNDVVAKLSVLTEGKQSEFFNHLKTGADSLAALMWIAYTGKNCGMSMPTAHVEESWHMAEFYSNKILVEYKNKDPNHVEWVKVLKELFVPGLRDYVKAHYPLGPVWSASGKTITTNRGPTPQAPTATQSSSSRPKQGMSAVFAELNSGKPVTSGLRKVTADMKSKNRTDRTGVVSVAEKESRARKPSVSKTGPPKFELQLGRKWVVENQIEQKDLVIDDCDAKQTVYIYGCQNSVLQIRGKVNCITLDKCSKMGLVFQDVVAACELVNCSSMEVQCQGVAPTISIDNTEGCQLYLSKDSLEASITTAKSEVNVLVPASEVDGDWAEHPLPQQYIHVYKDGQIVTTPMDHSGG
ncbi:cyclase-associated protein 1-like [Salvia miltiorrhiza]|uniref:cyclase-associated protein 1-like n=1 Tax=Salvia miltiorrhiza TaxID=226208 RepID=UPI0025AD3D3B|nr:cyclase-associated protein 1-like [Salvia miltiorrhiza]